MIDALYTAAAPALRAWIEENRARVVAVSQRIGKTAGGGDSPMSDQLRVAWKIAQGVAAAMQPRRADAHAFLSDDSPPVPTVSFEQGKYTLTFSVTPGRVSVHGRKHAGMTTTDHGTETVEIFNDTPDAYAKLFAYIVSVIPSLYAPEPRRLRFLTGTRWTFLDASRQFASKFPGTDALTGLPFYKGDLIVMARLAPGEKPRPVSVRGMRLLDLRRDDDGMSVTHYTFVTPDVDTDDLIARADSFSTMTKTGAVTGYKRSTTPGSPWLVNGWSARTEAQARANARKAWAIAALGYE